MSIRTNSNFEEAEEEGDIELVLVAMTYVGSRSLYWRETMRSQGHYPALDGFQSDETKIVKLPSHSLGFWEGHADFDVAYDEESIAEAMLDQNYLPTSVFGPGHNPGLRQEVVEKLGLDPAHDEEGWRDQLRDIAGYDGEPEEGERPEGGDDPRAQSLQDHDRSTLIKVANSYEEISGLLDEEDADSVSHLGQTELAAFLADREDADEVDRRIATAEQGGDL